jgi:Protein of unknown function (DUF1569)
LAKITTSKVANRRKLSFQSLDEISAEVERLANAREIRTLGNWSAGQNFKHLAIVMHGAIDGMVLKMPFPMNVLMPVIVLFMKKRFLSKPMPAGFRMNEAQAKVLIPPETSLEEGLAAIRSGLQRLKTETKREPHPFMGNLSRDEWTQLQCRHCELHLSFLDPI